MIRRDAHVVPGLCIAHDRSSEGKVWKTWAIYHFESEKKITGNLRTLKAAQLLLPELAGITDWTRKAKELAADPEIGRRVAGVRFGLRNLLGDYS